LGSRLLPTEEHLPAGVLLEPVLQNGSQEAGDRHSSGGSMASRFFAFSNHCRTCLKVHVIDPHPDQFRTPGFGPRTELAGFIGMT